MKFSSILLFFLKQKPKKKTPHSSSSSSSFFSTNSQSHTVSKCIDLLHTCASSVTRIKEIHAHSMRNNISLKNPDMGRYLISRIVTLSAPMSYAYNIFIQLDNPDVYIWNTMLRGYSQCHNSSLAFSLYRQMLASSIIPDNYTYPFFLKGILNVKEGKSIHSVTVKSGFDSLVFVRSSLLHMYAVSGDIVSAQQVFDIIPNKDLVDWSTMINGYTLNGKPNEALDLFREMSLEGLKPNEFTVVSLLSSSAELGALGFGTKVHMYIVKLGLIHNLHVSNSLLDFYAKCGSIREAKKLFSEMRERNLISWTSIIVGLAVNGFGEEALELFSEMERKHIAPDDITFTGVLNACSHAGLVDKGLEYFRRIPNQYDLAPKIEHYGCMVDLMGRAGLLAEAYKLIQNMPIHPNAVIWRTLLGASKLHGDLALAEKARSRISTLESKHSADYVLISNMYASEGRWSDVQRVRKSMKDDGVFKIPGYSFVELGNHTVKFVAGDKTHAWSQDVYAMLEKITEKLKQQGYVPHTENVLTDIEEEEKEQALSYHSEKLAIAFMLLNAPSGTPIRVTKNIRVCVDCHTAIKIISKVYDREIILRDCTRFHHFRGGVCSCRDYW